MTFLVSIAPTFSDFLCWLLQTDDALSNLELEYELQKQITSAAKKLSQDKSVSKYVRKQRRQSLHRAQAKVTTTHHLNKYIESNKFYWQMSKEFGLKFSHLDSPLLMIHTTKNVIVNIRQSAELVNCVKQNLIRLS